MKNNYLQIRGDRIGIELKLVTAEQGEPTFEVVGKHTASWITNNPEGNGVAFSDLRKGIEPWLTSLFQSEHLSLLAGSGLSTAVQSTARISSSNAMKSPVIASQYSAKLNDAAVESAKRCGHGNYPNIEDFIRVINELLQGLRILGHDKLAETEDERKNFDALSAELNCIIASFTEEISKIENSLVCLNDKDREIAFNYLINFLMSFASRTGTRDRLNIFTTNYDRIIEAGSELAGLRLVDRFVGIIAPIFNSSRVDIDMHYNPPGIRGEPRYLEGVARFTKLHGSIDWVDTNYNIRRIGLPFGALKVEPFLDVPGMPKVANSNIMIYPNSSKDRETAEYPFVELFRDFAATLCRPNSTLVTYGYGFGDAHINRIIKDMLGIPSTHLVIISYGDSEDRIKSFIDKVGRPSQISAIIGKDIAEFKVLIDHFLPKPSIDKASIRMSELIKQRYVETEKTKPFENMSAEDKE